LIEAADTITEMKRSSDSVSCGVVYILIASYICFAMGTGVRGLTRDLAILPQPGTFNGQLDKV